MINLSDDEKVAYIVGFSTSTFFQAIKEGKDEKIMIIATRDVMENTMKKLHLIYPREKFEDFKLFAEEIDNVSRRQLEE